MYYADLYSKCFYFRKHLLNNYSDTCNAKTKNKLWNVLKNKQNFKKHYRYNNIWITEM